MCIGRYILTPVTRHKTPSPCKQVSTLRCITVPISHPIPCHAMPCHDRTMSVKQPVNGSLPVSPYALPASSLLRPTVYVPSLICIFPFELQTDPRKQTVSSPQPSTSMLCLSTLCFASTSQPAPLVLVRLSACHILKPYRQSFQYRPRTPSD